jgi:hypothetical protein
MTAEIAILNKSAVALAADSAITLGSQKTYNSGNKLFSLSKFRPIGIMIYGNAEFMGIPWETIIKYYRSKLKDNKFNRLLDYANDLIQFIEKEDTIFWPRDVQEKYFNEIVKSYFQLIVQEINEQVKSEFSKGDSEETIKKIVSNIILFHHKKWQNAKFLFSECENYIKKIFEEYGLIIEKLKNDVFQELPISNEHFLLLKEICAWIFCKDLFSDLLSGVVIAGFGEKEIFPSAVEFHLETVLCGKLKFAQIQYNQSSREKNAIIMPIAQRDMVDTFVAGIDPQYSATINTYLKTVLFKYPEDILSVFPEISQERKLGVIEKINEVADKVLNNFIKRTNDYITSNHVNPILQAVNALPKDDLASMAESLVNLTSFKRKISLEIETVGGPIDVAVISKGDGFIWIKRKHYFAPELNPHFISNYYREDLYAKENKND